MNPASPAARILVVEDEPKLAQLLADYLHAAGFEVECLDNGLTALDRLRAAPPDLMLLDLMLPGLDGLSLCRALRSFSSLPVIMLTARVEESDRLLGLEIGADDYICKPFSPREVVARVRTVLRRSQPLHDNSHQPDDRQPTSQVNDKRSAIRRIAFRQQHRQQIAHHHYRHGHR